MTGRSASTFLVLHALRLEPLMEGSQRVTLALALLDRADPDPVPARAFRDAFQSTPSEASHVLARMRNAGLIVRDPAEGTYRLTMAADSIRSRLARILAGEELPDLGPTTLSPGEHQE